MTSSEQWRVIDRACQHLVALVANGWGLVVTHGNGPQAGNELRRSELAAQGVPPLPLDVIVAHTQGALGYMLAQRLSAAVARCGLDTLVAAVVTQVLVSADDPAMAEPSKPIGGYLDPQTAAAQSSRGWRVVANGQAWRRVVPSPQPQAILELETIRRLTRSGVVVVACGGGGIPVVRQDRELRGVAAVVDKDRASGLLARQLDATMFVVATSVDKVALDYGQPGERQLDQLALDEARHHLEQGQFPPGSMGPKIEALIEYVEQTDGIGVVCSLAHIERASRGLAGTRLVRRAVVERVA